MTVLVLLDLLAAVLAGPAVVLVRYAGNPEVAVNGVRYLLLVLVLAPGWPAALAVRRAYDLRALGSGGEETRRVWDTALRVAAGLGAAAFAVKFDAARSLLLFGVPAVAFLTVAFRHAARSVVRARRADGRWCYRALVVGSAPEVRAVARSLGRAVRGGIVPVGACTPEPHEDLGVPWAGTPGCVAEAAVAADADMVIAAGSEALGPDGLRRLGWSLEGSGVSFLVAPSLTDVVGARLTVRSVEDVVLLHVAPPEFSGARRVLKGALDRAGAVTGLLVLAPVLLLIVAVVRAGSPGPALFRQRRTGLRGEEFVCLKFRSMFVGAEATLDTLVLGNDADGLLFKLRDDPRVTRAGRFLRRYSLDELPQLWNVARGQMSLVGPRPPLSSEVARYNPDLRRRLLVKPGLTGLWQVSGRSDLAWDRSIELDLHYVANWSPTLDLLILARTVRAVFSGKGAY